MSLRYSQFYTHTYYLFNTQGHNIPVQVPPTEKGAGKCKILKCHVTLDECPDNENYSIGDLRVINGNHTVACISHCTKLSYAPPIGKGQLASHCTNEKYPNLKYMELMYSKCSAFVSQFQQDTIDEIIMKTECPGANNGHPTLQIVICP